MEDNWASTTSLLPNCSMKIKNNFSEVKKKQCDVASISTMLVDSKNVDGKIRKKHKKDNKSKHEVEMPSSENDKPTSCVQQKNNKSNELKVIEKVTKNGIELQLVLQSASGSAFSKSQKHRQSKKRHLKKGIDIDHKKSNQMLDEPLIRMESNNAYVLLERLPNELPSHGALVLNVDKKHNVKNEKAAEDYDRTALSLKQKKHKVPEDALINKSANGRTVIYLQEGRQELEKRKLSCMEDEADETICQIKRRHLESHAFRKEKDSNSQWMPNTVEPPGKDIHGKIKEKINRKKEEKNIKKDKRTHQVEHLEAEEQSTCLKKKSVPEFVQIDSKIIKEHKKKKKRKYIDDLDTDPCQNTKKTSSPSIVKSDQSNTNSIHSNAMGNAFVLLEKLPYKPTSNETSVSNAIKKKWRGERTEQNNVNAAFLEQKRLRKLEALVIGETDNCMEIHTRKWTKKLPGDENSLQKVEVHKSKEKHLSCVKTETKTGALSSQLEKRHIESQDCLWEEDTDLNFQWMHQSAETQCNETLKISKKKNVKNEKISKKVRKNMKEDKRIYKPTKQLYSDNMKIIYKNRKNLDNLNKECNIFESTGSSVSEQRGSENTHSIVKDQRQTKKTFIDDQDADLHEDDSVTDNNDKLRESVLRNNSDSNHCTLVSQSQKYLEQPNIKHRNQSCITRQDHGKSKSSLMGAGEELSMLEVISRRKDKKVKKTKKKKHIDLDCNENDATYFNSLQYSFGNAPADNQRLKRKKKECSQDNDKPHKSKHHFDRKSRENEDECESLSKSAMDFHRSKCCVSPDFIFEQSSKKFSRKSSNQKHGSQNAIYGHSSYNAVQDNDGLVKRAVSMGNSSVVSKSARKNKHFNRSLSLKKNDNISCSSKRNLHEDNKQSCTQIGGSVSLLIDNFNKTGMKKNFSEQSDITVEVDVTGLSEVLSPASSSSAHHFSKDEVENCEHSLSNSGLHKQKGKAVQNLSRPNYCSDLNALVVPPGRPARRATEDKVGIVHSRKDCPAPKSSSEPHSASKHASFHLSPDMFSQDSAWSRLSLDSNGVFTQTPENQIPLENCESPVEDDCPLPEQNREEESLRKSQSQHVGPGFTSLSSHDGSACEASDLSDSDIFRSSQEPLIPGRSCLKGLTQKIIVNPQLNKQDKVRKLTKHSNVSGALSNSSRGICLEKGKYKSRPYIDDSSDSCLSDDTRNLKGLPCVKEPRNVSEDRKKGSTNKKRLQCDNCLRSYLEKTFPTHKCVTTRFQCKHCERSYKRSWHLNHHVKVNHFNVKQYKCDICKKDFSEPQSLKVHKRLHHNIRPCKCRVCHKDYTTSSHLYRHYREVHQIKDEFTCEFCELSYSFFDDLERHTQNIHFKILKNL